MTNFSKYIILGIIMVFTISSDDPPKEKKDTIIVDTTKIQIEQLQLQKETKDRMSKWDSLMLKQDSLIKKK